MLDWETVQRLLVSTVAGLILGLPYRTKPGGLRAHLLVTIGATYFCTTALHALGDGEHDVLRVLQGITSGVGFIGAASVLKQGFTVHGVSTAASIWISAAIGSDAGLRGGYSVLFTATAITVLSILVGKVDEHYLAKERRSGPQEDPDDPGPG